jgi:hypothetical protein
MSDADSDRWPGVTGRLRRWSLVTGGRGRLAVLITLAIGFLTWLVIQADIIYVGPDSILATVLASGMLGALATVVTVTLSINQLILSRVFGAPADLTDQLEGNLEFRRTIENIAEVDTSPNDPGSFLALVAESLEESAAELEQCLADADDVDENLEQAVDDIVEELVEYARHLGDTGSSQSTFEVLSRTLGTEYAHRIGDVRRLRRAAADELPPAAVEHLDDIMDLLKGVATIRQFFKTLAVQQDLASLSRRLIYTGVAGLLVTFYLAQVYTPSGVPPMLPAEWLPLVVPVASAVIFAPIALLVSTLLRVATVTLYTVSVGSFIPPEERFGSS